MKDKIIQVAGVGSDLIALTQSGRLLDCNGDSGKWVELEVPKELLVLEDVPRFNFGKYKGEPIVDAPEDYIDWCRNNRDGFNWKKVEGKLVKQESIGSPLTDYKDAGKGEFSEEDLPF